MTIQGIDISAWQRTLDITKLPPDCQFVIVKATQGAGYTSPTLDSQARATTGSGRRLGLYHYVDGSGGAQLEAQAFARQAAAYPGAILAIDWESGSNRAWGNTGYLSQVIDTTARLTGRQPIIYTSASVLPTLAGIDAPRWVAQYANDQPTGFQPHPWNEGAYDCLLRQYSSAGRLAGYAGRLDLDVFYGDTADWDRLAGTTTTTMTTTTQTEDEMIGIIQINDEQALRYYDGQRLHTLTHPDQVTALNMAYQATHDGKSIPMFKLGSNDAPYGTRFVEAIQAE